LIIGPDIDLDLLIGNLGMMLLTIGFILLARLIVDLA
jgi:hypothetical protein